MAHGEARPAGDGLEAVGDGGGMVAVPPGAPGLDDLVWWINFEKFTAHREWAVAADAFCNPRPSNAHVAGPLRGAVRVVRAPPAGDVLARERPKDALGRDGDLDAREQDAIRDVGDGTG